MDLQKEKMLETMEKNKQKDKVLSQEQQERIWKREEILFQNKQKRIQDHLVKQQQPKVPEIADKYKAKVESKLLVETKAM